MVGFLIYSERKAKKISNRNKVVINNNNKKTNKLFSFQGDEILGTYVLNMSSFRCLLDIHQSIQAASGAGDKQLEALCM